MPGNFQEIDAQRQLLAEMRAFPYKAWHSIRIIIRLLLNKTHPEAAMTHLGRGSRVVSQPLSSLRALWDYAKLLAMVSRSEKFGMAQETVHESAQLSDAGS
jgi:hypothetical protein